MHVVRIRLLVKSCSRKLMKKREIFVCCSITYVLAYTCIAGVVLYTVCSLD